MNHDDLSDEQLFSIVAKVDKQCFDEGVDIRERCQEVSDFIMKDFGWINYTKYGDFRPPILVRIEDIFRSIYRPYDLTGFARMGAFMFRDTLARINVPIVLGQMRLDPFKLIDLTQNQIRIIKSEPSELYSVLDQFCDVFDVHDGILDLKPEYAKNELVVRFIESAQIHLHAATAVLTGGFNFESTVQSSLLATEFALKAGIASTGLSEKSIKENYGHKTDCLVVELGKHWQQFDVERVQRIIKKQPKLVQNRYGGDQLERQDVGHITMGAQYVVSEVVRQLSDQNCRAGFQPTFKRVYPG